MFLTITSIIVAALFGASFSINLRIANVNQRLRQRIDKLRGDLSTVYAERNRLSDLTKQQSAELKNYAAAEYTDNCEYLYMYSDCGFYTVLRQVKVNGQTFASIIKRFTDKDTDFNLREAQELCHILNEK